MAGGDMATRRFTRTALIVEKTVRFEPLEEGHLRTGNPSDPQ
jgi:hypothetical protein